MSRFRPQPPRPSPSCSVTGATVADADSYQAMAAPELGCRDNKNRHAAANLFPGRVSPAASSLVQISRNYCL